MGRLATSAGRLTGLTKDPARLAKLSNLYMPLGRRVVVIGGGLVGLELAEFIGERGRDVTVIESGSTFGIEMAHPRRWRVLEDLRDAGTSLVGNAQVKRITETAVEYTSGEDTQTVPADSVVIAVGLAANAALSEWSLPDSIKVEVLGDADGVTYIEGAIRDGFRAAWEL